jgi:hypothetical protein
MAFYATPGVGHPIFYGSSLESILIPMNVEIVGSKCFSRCNSLSSIRFESNSHLTRIDLEAFSFSSLQSILIPSTILFIASDAVDIASQSDLLMGILVLSFIDGSG